MIFDLVAYFSCIAATFNIDSFCQINKKSEEISENTSCFVKIQVDVDEFDTYSGQILPTKKYVKMLPIPKGSSSEVKVELKSFLEKFSSEPVTVHDAYVGPQKASSRIRGKIYSNIKTVCAKNKDLYAKMTVDLVDRKGMPMDYRMYKRNITARTGYLVAATATSALLMPIGITLAPLFLCFDIIKRNNYAKLGYHSGCSCLSIWEWIMYPQQHMWSRVFAEKGTRCIVVVVS
eukprot:jgi/Antlo1/1082/231